METKRCSKCGIEKPLNEFTYRNDKKTYVSYCKQCFREYSNKRSAKLREKDKGKYFVYKLLDEKLNILYIGKTNNLKRRIQQHMSTGFLPKDAIDEVKYISYICLPKQILSDIREIYYINKYKPKYNKQYKYEEMTDIGFDLIELYWKTIDLEDINSFEVCNAESSIDIISLYKNRYEITGKEVVQLDKETNEPIAVFPTGTQASKETGIDDGTIYKVLTKQRPNAGGYKWMKLSEWLELNK